MPQPGRRPGLASGSGGSCSGEARWLARIILTATVRSRSFCRACRPRPCRRGRSRPAFVQAEVARHFPREGITSPGCRPRPSSAGRRPSLSISRQSKAEASSGCSAYDGLAVGPLPGLELGQVAVQEFQLVGIEVICHGERLKLAAQVPPLRDLLTFSPVLPSYLRTFSPSSPIASCNFRIARIQSICTAGRERPMRSATSLNGSRSKLRRRSLPGSRPATRPVRPSSAVRRRFAEIPGWAWRWGRPARAPRAKLLSAGSRKATSPARAAWPCPDNAARNRPRYGPESASAMPATPARCGPRSAGNRETPPASSPAPGPRHRPSPAASSRPVSGRRNPSSCGTARRADPGTGRRPERARSINSETFNDFSEFIKK